MHFEERTAHRPTDATESREEPHSSSASEAPAGVVTTLAEQRRRERAGAAPPPLPSRRSSPPPLPVRGESRTRGRDGQECPSHRDAPPVVEPAAPPIAGLPAEAPSALERFHPRVLRRRWWWERWREVPCWLTSMVVHLAVMLVIGSLAVPPGRTPGHNTWLLVVAHENEQLTEADLTIFQTDQAPQDGGEQGDQPLRPANEPPAPDASPAPQPEPTPVEPPPAPTEDLAQHFPFPESEENDDSQEPPDAEPAPTVHLASAAATDEVPLPQFDANPPPAALIPSGEPSRPMVDHPMYDDIVDRFIEYDIGRLRGPAGEQARRDFERLGPYAVPALVKGLNRSASIQASCPVVVISSKLEQALAESNDYAMIRYAVDNIGRDVPEGAPHLDRLRALREALRAQHLDQAEAVRAELAAAGLPPAEGLVEKVVRYSQAPPAALVEAIHSPDRQTKLAAIVAAARLRQAIGDGQRSHLASQLLLELNDPSRVVRERAEAALTALLEVNLRASDRMDFDVNERAVFWRRQLDRFDQDRRIERKAHALLSQAMTQERRGLNAPAAERYRRVLNEFPATRAAREAAQRLRYLGG